MKFEDAQKKADEMIAALGSGWVADLKDTHGWRCSVKNGPCTVSFSENQQQYEAHVRLGAVFSGYSAEPLFALDVAVGKVSDYFKRITCEHATIVDIVAGTYLAGGAKKP